MRTARRAGWGDSPGNPFPELATLLPGSGSDEVFVAAAFGRPLAAWGARLVAPRPATGGSVVAGYRAALDAAMDAAMDAASAADAGAGSDAAGGSGPAADGPGETGGVRPAADGPGETSGVRPAADGPGETGGAGPGSGSDVSGRARPDPEPNAGGGAVRVPVLVGGVSLGAQVAAVWAAERAALGRPGPAGLLLVLPAWTGEPGAAPAAVAAGLAANAVRRDGLAAAVAATRESTPGWLGGELARAWTRHGDGLADSFATTARTPGPTRAQLASLRIPVGLVGLRDDPVHPLAVAAEWRSVLPRAALVTTTLAALGRDRETLGRAATLAWLRAALR